MMKINGMREGMKMLIKYGCSLEKSCAECPFEKANDECLLGDVEAAIDRYEKELKECR